MHRNRLLFLVCLFSFAMAMSVGAKTVNKPKMVKIETTLGTIKVLLYDETPAHRANFLKLVEESFYNDLLFHRVIKDFMIQAGDPDSRKADSTARLGSGGLNYTIPAEIKFPELFHKRGVLSSARLPDMVNPDRASSSCQFYIVQGKCYTDKELDEVEHRLNMVLRNTIPFKYSEAQRRHYKTFGGTPHLDAQYTVFGEMVEGFDVLDKISTVEVGASDRPKEAVRILSMKVVKR